MTAGIPIRVRRTIHDDPIDPIQLGGLLWHIDQQKLGIWNGTKMAWYPSLDPQNRQFILNNGQRLTGISSDGSRSALAISFETPGEMRIINVSNGNVIARFTANGTTVLANMTSTGALPGGSTQKISHPGFIPGLFRSKNSETEMGFIGPNSYLWKRATSSGSMILSTAYMKGAGDLTHFSAEGYTLKAEVKNDPVIATQGIGLRMWLFDTSLSSDSEFTNHSRVFFSVYGPANGYTTVRIGREGSYAEKEIAGRGYWTREYLDVPNHLITEDYSRAVREPFAIDFFYKTTPGNWYLNEPSIQNVDVVTNEVYQYRTLAERMAIADAYYMAPPTQVLYAAQPKVINLPMKVPALHAAATYTVEIINADRQIAISNKEPQGFRMQGVSPVEGAWTAKFVVGYHGRLTDIT